MIQISFHGAARVVTGSKYLIKVNDTQVLVDCGMFQGPRQLRQHNWQPLPFKPSKISAVVLTHGHIDHIGMVPKLVKDGYEGKIYTSNPTKDIVELSLRDSARIQEEDARYRNKKKVSRHKVVLPLFDSDDAEASLRMLSPVPFNQWIDIEKGIRFRLHVAGHILGASSAEFDLDDGKDRRTVLFSGDIGRYGNPLTISPAEPPECDYLVCESTYGGRIHPPSDPAFAISELVKEIIEKRKVLLIPAFSIGRTQQITFIIAKMIQEGQIRPIDIHIDSPMAISATEIYCKYADFHAIDISQLGGDNCVLDGPHVHFCRKRKDSQLLNKLKGPAIIISASGMMTAGRILHHLINRLGKTETVLALPGFMAEGTLGRRLRDGEKEVYIHKMLIKVKAEMVKLKGMSGHADWYELLHWLEPIKKAPRKVFVTHGELEQSRAMAEHLKKDRGWNCEIPVLGETVTL